MSPVEAIWRLMFATLDSWINVGLRIPKVTASAMIATGTPMVSHCTLNNLGRAGAGFSLASCSITRAPSLRWSRPCTHCPRGLTARSGLCRGFTEDPGEQSLGCCLLPREVSHKPAFPHDQHTMGEGEDFTKLRGDQQDPCSRLGEFGDQPVDFDLTPYIDPLCWFIEDEYLGSACEPLRKDDFLLIAPAELHGRGLQRWDPDAQLTYKMTCEGVHSPGVQPLSPQGRQHDVLPHREQHEQSLPVPVLRQERDTLAHGDLGRLYSGSLPHEEDHAVRDGQRAHQRLGEFCPP